MLALLFRHGVELPSPGSTNASLQVAGLWHRSHLRVLRSPWEAPAPAQPWQGPGNPFHPSAPGGADRNGLSVQCERDDPQPNMSRSEEGTPPGAASWLGIRKKPVLSVLWENPPSLLEGIPPSLPQSPCVPCSKHRNWGCSMPREMSGCSGGSSVGGMRPLTPWAGAGPGGSSADWLCQGGAPQTPDSPFDGVITADV